MKNIGVWLLSLVVVCMMSCAKPIAQFEIERKDNIAPSKVRFNNESQNAESYEWDFGDGNTSTEPAPEHRFQSSGNYVVSLKASKGKNAEISTAHVHTKGALAAARQPDEVNPEKKSSGSQFYIVHGQPVTEDYLDRIESLKDFKYSEADRKAYLENGGAPQLEMEYTVFGRVVDGFEVIDKIASVKTQPNNRPTEDVIMDFKIIE